MSRSSPLHSSRYLLSPSRRAWPLVGLVLALAGCPSPGIQGPPGAQGDPGDSGDPGAQGDPGADAATTLVVPVSLPRGDASCPYGGTRYDSGLDNGDGGGVAGDGVLQTGEVDSSRYVCNPPATFDHDYTPPTSPAGTSVMDFSGGDGGTTGGQAGSLFAFIQVATGGDTLAFANGTVDASFEVPGPGLVHLGSNPLVVAGSATLQPSVVDPGNEGSLADGTWFQYTGGAGDRLYHWTQGQAFQATGVHVEAGGTLVLPSVYVENPAVPAFDGARLVVPYDVQNDGTISAALSGPDRYPLAIWAQNYYGGPGSTIDLHGLVSTSGGKGGGLWIFGTLAPGDQPTTCPTGSQGGGVYNQGTVDTRPGADTVNTSTGDGRVIQFCGEKAVFNTGDLYATGRSVVGAAGGTVTLQASWGGVYNAGDIDASGGTGGTAGGQGGSITLAGSGIWNSGALLADGAGIGSAVNCAEICTGGDGGEITFQSAAGPILNSGSVEADGGAAAIAGNSTGGQAGRLRVSSLSTGGPISGPPGSVEWTGDIHLLGGDGAGTAGYGGEALMVIHSDGAFQDIQGQNIALYGYQQVVADGGDGVTAGRGGYYVLENFPFDLTPIISVGGTYNEVPFHGSGGQGTGAGDTYGGDGGVLGMLAGDPVGGPYAWTVNVAPVVAQGGAGTYGGPPGGLVMIGTTGVESAGSADLRGGAGDMTTGAGASSYGGEGALLRGGTVSVTADIDARGGDGAEGGIGQAIPIYGTLVDVAATIDVSGGDGNATSGKGGPGGPLDVRSSEGPTVVTGALVSDGGAGATSGAPGEIDVDGFPWQVEGP